MPCSHGLLGGKRQGGGIEGCGMLRMLKMKRWVCRIKTKRESMLRMLKMQRWVCRIQTKKESMLRNEDAKNGKMGL